MRPEQKIHLADLVHEHRERLQEMLTELVERGEPLSSLEARLIAELMDVRLVYVENALRLAGQKEAGGRKRDPRARLWLRAKLWRVQARIRSWAKPRIGVLRHYEPKPLSVPAKYMLTSAPSPAPLISIVTPSFQQGRFLERTLYSVVSQGYPALEYIVQDGASSDETVDVLRRLDPVLARWRSEPDGGQAEAINRGFQDTRGEIMAWLNSDDLLLPGSLAYVARYFVEHPNVDVVYGHRVMIDEGDGQIGAWILPPHDDLALTLADYVPQETLFWRRRIWDAVGGSVDPSFGYALDWDLLLRFRDAEATMVRLPRFLGAFRVHAAQKTTAADAVGQAECDRLRLRVHGRPVPIDEVLLRLRPYLRRHIVVHSCQRIVDRLPLRRSPVQTVPLEAWLGKADAESRREELVARESEDPVSVSLTVPAPEALVVSTDPAHPPASG